MAAFSLSTDYLHQEMALEQIKSHQSHCAHDAVVYHHPFRPRRSLAVHL